MHARAAVLAAVTAILASLGTTAQAASPLEGEPACAAPTTLPGIVWTAGLSTPGDGDQGDLPAQVTAGRVLGVRVAYPVLVGPPSTPAWLRIDETELTLDGQRIDGAARGRAEDPLFDSLRATATPTAGPHVLTLRFRQSAADPRDVPDVTACRGEVTRAFTAGPGVPFGRIPLTDPDREMAASFGEPATFVRYARVGFRVDELPVDCRNALRAPVEIEVAIGRSVEAVSTSLAACSFPPGLHRARHRGPIFDPLQIDPGYIGEQVSFYQPPKARRAAYAGRAYAVRVVIRQASAPSRRFRFRLSFSRPAAIPRVTLPVVVR